MPSSTPAERLPFPSDPDALCVWMRVGEDVPEGEDVLVWSAGKAVVGSLLVERRPDGTESRSFMDVLGNEILPWPTHWMRLPQPPQDRAAA